MNEHDPHQTTADRLGTDRESAKVYNYAVQYGAVEEQLKKIVEEARHRATDAGMKEVARVQDSIVYE